MSSTIRVHAIEAGLPAAKDMALNRVLFDPNRKTLSLSLNGSNVAYTELADADWTAMMNIVKKYVDPVKDQRVLAATWETVAEVNAKLAAEKAGKP